MKILAIDTAHGICSVALAENGVGLAQKTEHEPSRQAERLFLIIDEILKENSLSYKDINAIAANIGPGSFTGVRIGLAAARGIAIAAKIPVIGVNGFEALVNLARNKSKYDNFLVAFDARREQVFTQFFTKENLSEECLIGCGDIASLVEGEGVFGVIGDGAELIEPFLIENNSIYSIFSEVKLPDASMVAQVAFQKISGGNYDANPAPLYIRPPDAKLPKNSPLVNII